MGRPGYMSLYADEKTQQIFDEFVRIKGVTKSTALTEMLEIYMLSQDEELYMALKKKSLGIEVAKSLLLNRSDKSVRNDFIFMKLGSSYDHEENILDGVETMEAYIRNCTENGLGYTWFSTQSLHFGMAKKKVEYYNELIKNGETVKILFAIGDNINEIKYSASVMGIVSNRQETTCGDLPESIPEEFGPNEMARIWIMLEDIKEEKNIKAAMLKIRSTDANLKQVISNSQFHFGYVYLK